MMLYNVAYLASKNVLHIFSRPYEIMMFFWGGCVGRKKMNNIDAECH